MKKNELLNEIVNRLSLSKTAMETLARSYNYIGEWLTGSDEISRLGDVSIKPQGSVGLGTAIKPISDDDEYDVDLVCIINNSRLKSNLKLLKHSVGNRLKEHENYKDAEEGKRCWKVQYSNYHMDILPCCPDDCKANYLVATEKVNEGSYIPHSTNPIEYRDWFLSKCRKITTFEAKSIDPIKVYDEISHLQMIVQLLKRHRDMWIENNKKNVEDKPISIIITTLAAKSYIGTGDLYVDFVNVVKSLKNNIQDEHGKIVIKNPVDSEENFADKWVSHPNRRTIFFEWLRTLENDIDLFYRLNNDQEIGELAKKLFGENIIKGIYGDYAKTFKGHRENGSLYADSHGKLNTNNGNQVKEHKFYGI